MIELPEMTVELRESDTAHGITAPTTDVDQQLEYTIELNHRTRDAGISKGVLDLLQDYSPIQLPDPAETRRIIHEVTGLMSWYEVSSFVATDVCMEFYNMCLKHCITSKQPEKENLGFINGVGLGYIEKYRQRLNTTLNQTFDAKYFYKKLRPLAYAIANKNLDLSNIALHIHPGHWSYPAGHGCKFLTTVECLDADYHLSDKCYRELLIAAVILAHGRSGCLIHFPEDNCATTTLLNLRD